MLSYLSFEIAVLKSFESRPFILLKGIKETKELLLMCTISIKIKKLALADVAQWIEHQPVNCKVAG